MGVSQGCVCDVVEAAGTYSIPLNWEWSDNDKQTENLDLSLNHKRSFTDIQAYL